MNVTLRILRAVLNERRKQVAHGYDAAHDDEHGYRMLANVGAFLSFGSGTINHVPDWAGGILQRYRKDVRGLLVIAAAFIVAAIEAFDRASPPRAASSDPMAQVPDLDDLLNAAADVLTARREAWSFGKTLNRLQTVVDRIDASRGALMSGMSEYEGPVRWMRPDESSVWPDPSTLGPLEWSLRYADPTREDLLAAASVVAAYRQLLLVCTRDRMAQIRRTARKAGGAE